MIEVSNLNFSYGTNQVLKDIEFSVSEKQVVSLIGPNGSGKSTLLRVMAGLLKSKDSRISFLGKNISEYSHSELSKTVAFLPQIQNKLSGISVYELVSLGRTPYQNTGWFLSSEDRDKIRWAMEYMQVDSISKSPINELSGGQKQRVWLAMILAQDTPIILLDEPVTYLDLHYQYSLLSTIRDLKEKYDKTIISVFHDINHAIQVSDMVIVLNEGKIFDLGLIDEMITEHNINSVFNIDANVCRVGEVSELFVVPHISK